VVLLDQRGAGRSEPVASLESNTTQHLIADIETLRNHLNIQQWHMVFGGSWGSTLALAYAEAHPSSLCSLVLRGIFLGMAWEADWTLRGFGAGTVFPDAWEEYLSFLPEDKRSDPVTEYHRVLTTGTREEQLKAAYYWNKWELSISNLVRPGDAYDKLDQEDWNLQHARIEAHYFANTCFLAGEKELSRKENVARIAHLPGEEGHKPA
jgi:proline iminopeptidase